MELVEIAAVLFINVSGELLGGKTAQINLEISDLH